MGEDTGGRVGVWRVCGQCLLVASALSVKSETRSLAESEDGDRGGVGLRHRRQDLEYPNSELENGCWVASWTPFRLLAMNLT